MILFNFASRSRPDKFKQCVENIRSLAVHPYVILVKADSDDSSMGMDYVPKASDLIYSYGISNNKIHAINRDIDKVKDWDILINMSDDMLFNKYAFDDTIINSFDNNDQFLHFPDGNRNDLATMSIMGRKYYDRFNYVYHPSYISLWCDNEAQEVAQSLGCYKYCNIHIFDHLHPAWGKGNYDMQYKKTESYNPQDKMNYETRKYYGFPIYTDSNSTKS